MTKKIFTCLAIIFLSLCCSVCFASENSNSGESNDSNVNLGEEITDSLNKTGESIKNVTNDAMNTGTNNSKNTNNNNNFTNSGTNYNATRTSVEDSVGTETTNLSTTTWIWIIMAVVAIIIVAMVWYYAVQDNTKD